MIYKGQIKLKPKMINTFWLSVGSSISPDVRPRVGRGKVNKLPILPAFIMF